MATQTYSYNVVTVRSSSGVPPPPEVISMIAGMVARQQMMGQISYTNQPVIQPTNQKCQLCGDSGKVMNSENTYDCPHCVNHMIVRERKESPEISLRLQCEICLEDETSILFNECKHICGCKDCVKIVRERENGMYKCPKCNIVSDQVTEIYV